MNDKYPQYEIGQFVYWRRQTGHVVSVQWDSGCQWWEYAVKLDSAKGLLYFGEEELSGFVGGV